MGFISEREQAFLHAIENLISMAILTGIGVVFSVELFPLYWWNAGLIVWSYCMIGILINDNKIF